MSSIPYHVGAIAIFGFAPALALPKLPLHCSLTEPLKERLDKARGIVHTERKVDWGQLSFAA